MDFEHGAELTQPRMLHRHVGKGTTRLQRNRYAPPEHVLLFADVELQFLAPADVVRPTFMSNSERVPARPPLQRTARFANVLQGAEAVLGCEVVYGGKDVVQVHGLVSRLRCSSENAAGERAASTHHNIPSPRRAWNVRVVPQSSASPTVSKRRGGPPAGRCVPPGDLSAARSAARTSTIPAIQGGSSTVGVRHELRIQFGRLFRSSLPAGKLWRRCPFRAAQCGARCAAKRAPATREVQPRRAEARSPTRGAQRRREETTAVGWTMPSNPAATVPDRQRRRAEASRRASGARNDRRERWREDTRSKSRDRVAGSAG